MAVGLGAALGFVVTAQQAFATPDPAAAQAFIRSLADRATAVVQDRAIGQSEREERLRALLRSC